MLYEFDIDDVIKGVWLYDRKKTTVDFYEQIYGEIHRPFIEYLIDWGEIDENQQIDFYGSDFDENRTRMNTSCTSADYTSMNGVAASPMTLTAEDMAQRADSIHSI